MYEIFEQLLQKNGVTPYKVAKSTGISQTTLSSWKTGRLTPKIDKLKKIADYFGVSTDYLQGIAEEPEEDFYYLNKETKEIAQEIFENKDMRILFDVARGTTPERLKTYARFLKELQDKEEQNDN